MGCIGLEERQEWDRTPFSDATSPTNPTSGAHYSRLCIPVAEIMVFFEVEEISMILAHVEEGEAEDLLNNFENTARAS